MPSETSTRTAAPTVPLISVLMPALNEEKSIGAAVESVLSQTHPNVELLVIDGRSGDRTAEIVRELSAREPRVRLLSNPARRIPNALNVGLHAARGEFIARVDAHGGVSHDYLERGLVQLQDREVASVGGRRIGVAESARGRAVAAVLSSRFGVGSSVNHYGTRIQDTDHSSFGVYRRSVLLEMQGWDETLAVNEDADVDHRIVEAGHRIRYDPDMEIHWKVRETLRDFGRQYRRYGRGKAHMVRKNGGRAMRLRHLAAPGLIVWLGCAAAALATGHPKIAATLAGTYAGVLGVGALDATRGRPEVNRLDAAAALATMHVAWGLGFWEGLLFNLQPATASQVIDRPDSPEDLAENRA